MQRRTLLAGLAVAPLAAIAYAREAFRGRRESPPTSAEREAIRERYFPNVVLTTHLGKEVRFYDDLIKSKIVTINFMFTTCPKVCPRITENLVKVQKLLGHRVGRDIFMYSITLDPENDTSPVLKKYAKIHHVGAGWLFLTGKPDDIELLRRKLGFTYTNPQRDKDKEKHIGNVRYGNEPLQLWAACPGLAHAEWIAESISWVDWPKNRLAGRRSQPQYE
ncbi:MAG: SCO family protein [Acidobacteria bacterium]|nr:MAG: SCO family protein [Acidobacteriota bacterium]